MENRIKMLIEGGNAAGDDLDRGSRCFHGGGGALASGKPKKPACASLQSPPELIEFARSKSVRDVAKDLGVARSTVHRLRHGYWPNDTRKLVSAWQNYKGRVAVLISSWFLRRVQVDYAIKHGKHCYTADCLRLRAGELIAVAKAPDGGLVAQTLELPLMRFHLHRIGA